MRLALLHNFLFGEKVGGALYKICMMATRSSFLCSSYYYQVSKSVCPCRRTLLCTLLGISRRTWLGVDLEIDSLSVPAKWRLMNGCVIGDLPSLDLFGPPAPKASMGTIVVSQRVPGPHSSECYTFSALSVSHILKNWCDSTSILLSHLVSLSQTRLEDARSNLPSSHVAVQNAHPAPKVQAAAQELQPIADWQRTRRCLVRFQGEDPQPNPNQLAWLGSP